jgi:rare lipoprotein A
MKKPIFTIFIFPFIISTIISAIVVYLSLSAVEAISIKHVPTRPSIKRTQSVPTTLFTPTPPSNRLKSQYLSKRSWNGKVSHYSRAGCLGCSPTLTMANGRPLDDDKSTIAFNYLPLGSMVKITNLDNGKNIIAEVTDTGGFNRLGRIADLTPKVYSAIESKTDVSQILIEEL